MRRTSSVVALHTTDTLALAGSVSLGCYRGSNVKFLCACRGAVMKRALIGLTLSVVTILVALLAACGGSPGVLNPASHQQHGTGNRSPASSQSPSSQRAPSTAAPATPSPPAPAQAGPAAPVNGSACTTASGYYSAGLPGYWDSAQNVCVPNGSQPENSNPNTGQAPPQQSTSVPPGMYAWPGGGYCNIPFNEQFYRQNGVPGVCQPAGSKNMP
jgi:hypothetical protein